MSPVVDTGLPDEEPSPPTLPAETTLALELLAGLLGALIALGCFLPPLVHFVSGPLGPLIGAFVVSNRWRLSVRGQALVPLTIGSVLAGVVAAVAAVVRSSSGSRPPSWFPAPDALAVILGGVWVWGAAFGAAGIALSVAFRKQPPPLSAAR